MGASRRERIDKMLVTRGFFRSREQAQRALMAGQVLVGERVVDKPGSLVSAEAEIRITGMERFVGRGGSKLEAALDHLKINPAGWRCLDVGASTGGFTDCLLQRGAARVTALDVGHNQIAYRLRTDPRVSSGSACSSLIAAFSGLHSRPVPLRSSRGGTRSQARSENRS
jgi:23S rRNA (cytidine1920-2'-O)/16S rRNA (cytidine1409-2'-O)-methyltransferase